MDQDGGVHLTTDQITPDIDRLLRRYGYALPYNQSVYADLDTYDELGHKLYTLNPEDKLVQGDSFTRV